MEPSKKTLTEADRTPKDVERRLADKKAKKTEEEARRKAMQNKIIGRNKV